MATIAARKPSLEGTKLYLDVILLGAFVAANLARGTGVVAHEWLGVAFVVPLALHLVLDWSWIVAVTRRLFRSTPAEVRFNHVLDLASYVVMVVVLFSGLAESRVALPALGIHLGLDRFWIGFHRMSTDVLMVLVGVHLAMHFRWIVDAFRRRVLGKGHVTSKRRAS